MYIWPCAPLWVQVLKRCTQLIISSPTWRLLFNRDMSVSRCSSTSTEYSHPKGGGANSENGAPSYVLVRPLYACPKWHMGMYVHIYIHIHAQVYIYKQIRPYTYIYM